MTPDPIPPAAEDPPETRSTAGMTTKVVKGSLWTLAGQIAPMAVTLIATPFTIRLLGSAGYGVFILVALIPTYLGFADFGMGLGSTKFASAAYADGDLDREARIVRTSALIALASSIPFALAMLLFSAQIIGLFKVPDELHADAVLALRFASVTFVIGFLNNIFNTPQLTRLRMDLNTFVNAGFRILGQIAVPLALFFIGGVAAATFVLMIVSILNLFGHLLVSRSLLRELFGTSIERSALRPLFKFGVGLVLASIAAIFLVNAEKGILAATVSATALAHYSVAFTLASMMTFFSSSMTQSLLPAFSQLQSGEKREQLNSLYSRGIRLSLIVSAPVLVIVSLLARPFFTRWAGTEFGAESTLPFYILALGIAFNIIAYLPYTALMASGRTDIFAKLYWVELVLYVVLVWFLASRYAAIGAAIAWSIRVIIDAFIQFGLARRLAGVSFSNGGLFWYGVALVILLVPFAANLYFPVLNATILVSAIFCLIAYTIIIWKTMLEKEEIAWFSRQLTARFSK